MLIKNVDGEEWSWLCFVNSKCNFFICKVRGSEDDTVLCSIIFFFSKKDWPIKTFIVVIKLSKDKMKTMSHSIEYLAR